MGQGYLCLTFLTMDRRESLKASAFFIGNALAPSLVSGFFDRCASLAAENKAWEPAFFSKKQASLLPELVEAIIPETDTPGAKAAMVHVFIDLYVKDCYPAAQQQVFMLGLDELQTGHSFLSLDRKAQTGLLTQLEMESLYKNEPVEKSFVKMLKTLAIMGYFTSEIGASKAAEYMASPGPFQGCIDMKPGQKVSAL
jgi:hypothetical protein